MKKFISMAAAAVLACSATAVLAEETPTVILDGREIIFGDQQPVIKDDRTLIPVRGVFEAMGAKIQWHGEEKRVQIDSEDNFTRVYLTIDSDNMEHYRFRDIFSSDRTDITLDVPAQIINDRTMIPLRAVADAFGCEVEWLGDEFKAIINTGEEALPTDETAENTYVYLSTEADDVSADETFDVYVSVKNLANYTSAKVVAGSAALIYDKSKFEFISSTITAGEEEVNAMQVSNPDFSGDSVKIAFASIAENTLGTDGAYIKATFKALTDEGGEIMLSNRYNTKLGFDMKLSILNNETNKITSIASDEFGVDTTPIVLK